MLHAARAGLPGLDLLGVPQAHRARPHPHDPAARGGAGAAVDRPAVPDQRPVRRTVAADGPFAVSERRRASHPLPGRHTGSPTVTPVERGVRAVRDVRQRERGATGGPIGVAAAAGLRVVRGRGGRLVRRLLPTRRTTRRPSPHRPRWRRRTAPRRWSSPSSSSGSLVSVVIFGLGLGLFGLGAGRRRAGRRRGRRRGGAGRRRARRVVASWASWCSCSSTWWASSCWSRW